MIFFRLYHCSGQSRDKKAENKCVEGDILSCRMTCSGNFGTVIFAKNNREVSFSTEWLIVTHSGFLNTNRDNMYFLYNSNYTHILVGSREVLIINLTALNALWKDQMTFSTKKHLYNSSYLNFMIFNYNLHLVYNDLR